MQFSAIVNRFILKNYLNSAFTNDLKRKYFFPKMFIVADLGSLKNGDVRTKLLISQLLLIIDY